MNFVRNSFFILLLIFISCSREIEIDIPEQPTMLVASSVLHDSSKASIRISKLISILDDKDNEYISDVEVILYENAIPFDTLSYNTNGIFVSKFETYKGNIYSFKASANGFPTISSRSIIPEKPNVSNIINTDSAIIDKDGYYLSKLQFTINDPASEENYYSIGILSKHETYSNLIYLKTLNDPIINAEGLSQIEENDNLTNVYISDKMFNGKSQTFSIYYDDFSKSDTLVAIISSLSKDLFEFKKKLLLHREYQNGSIFAGYLQPVTPYTNIEGGQGVFGSENEISKTIHIKK